MIDRIDINGVHSKIDENLKKYVFKKVGKLDKYVPRKLRGSLHAEVKLKENKNKSKQNYECEVILHLPHDVLTARDTTMNMYAAIDIVEQKIKSQLLAYKDDHTAKSRGVKRMLAKLRNPF